MGIDLRDDGEGGRFEPRRRDGSQGLPPGEVGREQRRPECQGIHRRLGHQTQTAHLRPVVMLSVSVMPAVVMLSVMTLRAGDRLRVVVQALHGQRRHGERRRLQDEPADGNHTGGRAPDHHTHTVTP